MPERFGDFELLALLSADAALESFEARAPGTSALVVLRRMRSEQARQPGARDAFLNDAHAAMRLQHAGAARVVAVGEVAHLPYLAQERVEGISLEELLVRARASASGWPLPVPRALALFLPALEGLAAAHAQAPALLHREVSPRNIFVTREGRAVLSGFALARTRRSAGLGIADAFLSPEQMTGRPLDASSDVFTAALVLFELACGRLPATGTVGEICARIGTLELDAPEDVHPGAAPLAQVLRRALSKDRYKDAGQFLEALNALQLTREPSAELGRWLTTLPEAPLPPARPMPAPAPPRPEVFAGRVNLQSLVAPPVEGKPIARQRRFARLGMGVLAGLVVLGGAQWLAYSPTSDPVIRANPVPEAFDTEVVSVPTGALVRVNDQRVGKTPTRFRAERDHLYTVHIEDGDMVMETVVQNSQRLEVDLSDQTVMEDVRFVPNVQRRKKEKKEKVEPAPVEPPTKVDPPAPTVLPLTSFEGAAPLHFVLEKPHQVRVEEVAQLPLRADVVSQSTAGYRSVIGRGTTVIDQANKTRSEQLRSVNASGFDPTNGVPTGDGVVRHLSMMLTRTAAGVALRAINPGPVPVPALPSWAFAVSERIPGAHDQSPTFRLGAQQGFGRSASLVLIVEQGNRFTVSGLGDEPVWRIALHAKDKARAASVVMRARPCGATPVQLDGLPQETGTFILGSEANGMLGGACSAWFTVPTVSGFEPSAVEVSVESLEPRDPPKTTLER